MASVQMVFDIIARDNASNAFRRVSGEASGAAASLDRAGKAAAGATAIFGAFAAKAAIDFQASMARVSTQAGVPIKQIKGLSDAVLNLAPKVGVGPDQLATSLYHVESAFKSTGISAQKAIDIVTQAAKLSKIGNADIGDTTQAIIGTLASGIKGVRDATDAAAQINQLVGSGDTTLQAVDKSIATGILPTSSALGLSFKDVAAAIATVTDNATPADEAATRLRTTFSTIEKPTKSAGLALEGIGLSTTSLAEDFRKPDGLLVALQDLKKHLNETYPLTKSQKLSTDEIAKSTKTYTDQLIAQGASAKDATTLGDKYADMLKRGGSAATQQAQVILQAFGGARSGSTFLTLYTQIDRLQSKYKEFGSSADAAAKFQESWNNTQKTAKQALSELGASFQVFLIQAGNYILPVLKGIADVLREHPGIIKAAAIAVGVFAAAWATVKLVGLASRLSDITLAFEPLRLGALRTADALRTLGGGSLLKGGLFAGAGIAAVVGLGTALFNFAKSTGEAKKQLADIKKMDITDVLDPAQLTKALADTQAEMAHQASKFNFGNIVGLTGGIFSGSTWKDFKIATSEGTKQLQQLQGSLDNLGLAGDHAFQKFGLGADQFKKLAAAAHIDFGSDFKSLAAGEAQFDAVYGASLKSAGGAKVLQAALKDTASGAALTDDELTALVGTLDELNGKELSSIQASDQFHQSLNDLATSLADNSRELVGSSDAAIQNREAIIGLVTQAEGAAQAYAKSTGKASDYTNAMNLSVPAIEAAAAANGFNKGQIDALVRSILTVPPNTPAKVTADTVDAQGRIDGVKQSLAQLQDKTVNIDVVTRTFNQTFTPATPGGVPFLPGNGGLAPAILAPGNATGGYIRGPGTSTSDSIPSWLSNGEYVIPANRVKQLGVGFFEAIRNGAMPGFASGGSVGDAANVKAFLQALAQISKIGVTGALKTTTGDIKAGQKAIADAVKEGNGPLQKYVGAYLKAAQERLYGTSLRAVQDKVVTPQEALAIKAAANTVESLTKQLTKLNTVNQLMLDKLKSFVQTQTQFRDSLQSTVSQGNTFSDVLSHSGTGGDVVTLLQDKLTSIKKYGQSMTALRNAGYSDAIVREISSDGITPAIQYAQLLLGLPKAQQTQIKSLAAQLSTGQLNTANALTMLTQGSAGLTNQSAVDALNKAIYNPGANVEYWEKQAEFRQRTGAPAAKTITMQNVEKQYIGSNVDMQQVLKQQEFLLRSGSI